MPLSANPLSVTPRFADCVSPFKDLTLAFQNVQRKSQFSNQADKENRPNQSNINSNVPTKTLASLAAANLRTNFESKRENLKYDTLEKMLLDSLKNAEWNPEAVKNSQPTDK